MTRWTRLAVCALAAAVLAACGGDDDQPATIEWRNITLDVPDGWYRVEEAETRLSISNQPLHEVTEGSDLPADEDVVAMYLTFEPDTLPEDWRDFAEQQDATIETDDQLVLDGEVPATRLIMAYESNGVPTREMMVIIPSRHVVIISQPIPSPQETDAPEVFLEHLDTFMEVLDSIELGAPVLE